MWKRILTAVLAIAILALTMGQAKHPRYGYDTRYYSEEVRPVADKIWVSTTGDMNAAASYSPSGVPIGNDNLYFVGKRNGGSDVSATINTAALNGTNLIRVRTHPWYPGDIGTIGTPAEIGDVTTTRFVHQGTGSVYQNMGAIFFVCDSPNRVNACRLSASMGHVVARRGHLAIANGAVIDRLDVLTYGGRSEPYVDFEGVTGDIEDMRMTGGTVHCTRDQAAGKTLQLAGGTWIHSKDSTGGLTTAFISGGGTLVYNSVGTFDAVLMSGTLDFEQDAAAKQMGTLIHYVGADLLDNDNVTITNYIDLTAAIPTYGW